MSDFYENQMPSRYRMPKLTKVEKYKIGRHYGNKTHNDNFIFIEYDFY